MIDKSEQVWSFLFSRYMEGKAFLSSAWGSIPEFSPNEFCYITPLAYPVAVLEVDVMERTREDFSVVEKAILKMIKNGISEPRYIARLLGITESYAEKMKRLLYSNGHIGKAGITELGEESLKEDKSIKLNEAKQKIYVDGIAGNPISIREFINEKVFRSPAKSGSSVPHLEPIDQVETEQLIRSIRANYTDYVDKGEFSLHINVDTITDITFVETKYAIAYYLENAAGECMIICQCYDSTAKSMKKRTYWRALYSNRLSLLERYGLGGQEVTHDYMSSARVTQMRELLEEERKTKEEQFLNQVEQLCPFNWEKTQIEIDDPVRIVISKDSIGAYNKYILNMLYGLGRQGADYIILGITFGRYAVIESQDEDLLELARRYALVGTSKEKRASIASAVDGLLLSEQGGALFLDVLKKVVESIELDD